MKLMIPFTPHLAHECLLNLNCDQTNKWPKVDIKAIDKIEFSYFSSFANSGELEVQFISELGSTSFEVVSDKPFINTEGKI